MRFPIGLFWGAAAVAAGSIGTVLLRRRKDPREKERLRRDYVNLHGRMIEGSAAGCIDGFFSYSYQWRGVRYDTSQDVSDFMENGPWTEYVGPVTVKFLGRKPLNSIVVCEGWSGIPKGQE